MNSKIFLFAALACFVVQSEASELLKAITPTQAILQKFVDMVQTHKLNVSIVTSRNQYWSNGQLQDVRDSALLLPPNHLHLTQSQLTQQVGKQWIADMASITSGGKAIANYRVVTVQSGNVQEQLVESTNEQAMPITPSYESILDVHNGVQGYAPDLGDWQITYNFKIPVGRESVHNIQPSVQLIAANLNITVVASHSISQNEISIIQNLLPSIWMKYNTFSLIASNLVEVLDQKLPNSNWQVIIGTEDIYVGTNKYVTFSVLNDLITVFSVTN